jgi:hypothetical protein
MGCPSHPFFDLCRRKSYLRDPNLASDSLLLPTPLTHLLFLVFDAEFSLIFSVGLQMGKPKKIKESINERGYPSSDRITSEKIQC